VRAEDYQHKKLLMIDGVLRTRRNPIGRRSWGKNQIVNGHIPEFLFIGFKKFQVNFENYTK
jgi:hypothetical protein